MKNGILIFVVALGLTNVSLSAAVVPGRWEKVERLSQGEPITVTLMSGDRIEATFVHLSQQNLAISDSNGNRAKVPRSEVGRVEGKMSDPTSNGVLLGAGIGFAVPVIVTFASGVDRTEYPLGLGIGVIGAAVGGLVGWRVDKAREGAEVLYQAAS